MKVLIFGLGSIGQRHVRLLKELYGESLEIGAYRQRKKNWVISDKLGADLNSDPCEFYGIKAFYDLENALAWSPDIAFITNPIHMHINTAILAAENGMHLFIEKPLGHSLNELDKLEKIVEEKKLKCFIAYQSRFHPAYKKVKELIRNETIGKVCSGSLHFGEWLPGMHPYEDYRISHASRKKEGGGVTLCLSHEIDMAYWLFGKPSSVYSVGGNLSPDLEMDGVEDIASISLKQKDSKRSYPVNIHLDFIQKPPKRELYVVGSKGKVVYDYHTSILTVDLIEEGRIIEEDYSSFERNEMFKEEIQLFFESIKKNTETMIPLSEGRDVLEVCMACKESLERGIVIKVGESLNG